MLQNFWRSFFGLVGGDFHSVRVLSSLKSGSYARISYVIIVKPKTHVIRSHVCWWIRLSCPEVFELWFSEAAFTKVMKHSKMLKLKHFGADKLL